MIGANFKSNTKAVENAGLHKMIPIESIIQIKEIQEISIIKNKRF